LRIIADVDPILSLRDVARDFATRGRVIQAMAGLSLDVGTGEFLTIVGPSGCGKSRLLNIVSGLLPPSSGEVRYKGAPVSGVNTEIGYLTQADTLYPWRTLDPRLGRRSGEDEHAVSRAPLESSRYRSTSLASAALLKVSASSSRRKRSCTRCLAAFSTAFTNPSWSL